MLKGEKHKVWTMPVSTDMRRLTDRRTCPTTLWSALRWHGRRKGFRRAGEGVHAYVDYLSPRVSLLVLWVVTCSVFDALFTLLYLSAGGREANPFMAVALNQGVIFFTVCKMGLTGAGAWLLAAHQQFPLAMRSLYALAYAYTALMGLHLILLF